MPKIEGGCLCGSVRYETDAEPLQTAICHCKNCQKQSGTAFSVVVCFPKDSLKVTGHTLKNYPDKGVSGGVVNRLFCSDCGSPLITRAEFSSDFEFIKAGSLDDTSWLKPEAEYWCAREHDWMHGDKPWPKFNKNPE